MRFHNYNRLLWPHNASDPLQWSYFIFGWLNNTFLKAGETMLSAFLYTWPLLSSHPHPQNSTLPLTFSGKTTFYYPYIAYMCWTGALIWYILLYVQLFTIRTAHLILYKYYVKLIKMWMCDAYIILHPFHISWLLTWIKYSGKWWFQMKAIYMIKAADFIT